MRAASADRIVSFSQLVRKRRKERPECSKYYACLAEAAYTDRRSLPCAGCKKYVEGVKVEEAELPIRYDWVW